MAVSIRDPEIFGVTESSATLSFSVEDVAGPVEAEARIHFDGELRTTSNAVGTHLVRIEGLEPGRRYTVGIESSGAVATPDEFFSGDVETLPATDAVEVATFGTMNDLHFGEPRFGGTLLPNGDYGEEAPGFPAMQETDTEVPYWQFMNDDAIDEIGAAGADLAIIKGDIADSGLPEQFAAAAASFARFAMPHCAFLGNHDYYARNAGLEVDGYALLGQPPAPRSVDLGGWRLVMLETVEPGEHHGVFGDERRRWLSDVLDETREIAMPTLVLMHHQPVPPEFADKYPNNIGMHPPDSLALFDLIRRHPQLRGVLIGHTHRNRVRRYKAAGSVPFVEIQCTKDYPGGWGHYRLFDDGSFRQEVRRTGSERALAHSSHCQNFFAGGYRRFALGPLSHRSFAIGAMA